MQARDYVTIAAFSALVVVLAYLSSFATIVPGFISFYLPLLVLWTVPIWFGKQGLTIGFIGVAGKNLLVTGVPQSIVGEFIFSVVAIMGAIYFLSPPRFADMKKPLDAALYVIMCTVLGLLIVGVLYVNSLLGVFPPDIGLMWTIAWTSAISNIPIAIINVVLFRTITPVLKRSGLYSGKTQQPITPPA